ncbi:hypothetical protein GCM10022383_07180 [Microbacterium soli]|uniref:Uncharacterized protein n=2 Tax=Microbacterium soli TaxID=446075 RepID=A0ABP7MXW4_9MICO
MRGAIWIAIGSLIAAALVCVVWVLVGNQDGIIGRAFLTILLLAVFAGIAIVESNLASRRPDWLALTSMITWIVALLVGAVKIWLPSAYAYGGWQFARFLQLLLVVGILQLALLHVRLYLTAAKRYVTTFTRVIVMVTLTMLALLVLMLVFFLTFPDQFDYSDLYWRIVIALAILAAVGTTLIPLLNALFAPRSPRATPAAMPRAAGVVGAQPDAAPAQPVAAWPTYADGRTPLPVMPDGSPDWNAYYTGHPTYAQQQGFPALGGEEQYGTDAGAADAVQAGSGAPEVSPFAPPVPPVPPAPPAYAAFPPPPASEPAEGDAATQPGPDQDASGQSEAGR